MRCTKVLRQFVLSKLSKAPSINVQISALDVLVICQALLAWSAIHPGSKMVKNLAGKLQNILFNLLPSCRNEIESLLTGKTPKNYGNTKTNS